MPLMALWRLLAGPAPEWGSGSRRFNGAIDSFGEKNGLTTHDKLAVNANAGQHVLRWSNPWSTIRTVFFDAIDGGERFD